MSYEGDPEDFLNKFIKNKDHYDKELDKWNVPQKHLIFLFNFIKIIIKLEFNNGVVAAFNDQKSNKISFRLYTVRKN